MNGTSNSLLQAIRGPIMLITLGSLVAIDYFGIYGFSRTWPLLIIVFGVLKLLEKIFDHPGQYPPQPQYTPPAEYTAQRQQYPPQQGSSTPPPGGNVI